MNQLGKVCPDGLSASNPFRIPQLTYCILCKILIALPTVLWAQVKTPEIVVEDRSNTEIENNLSVIGSIQINDGSEGWGGQHKGTLTFGLADVIIENNPFENGYVGEFSIRSFNGVDYNTLLFGKSNGHVGIGTTNPKALLDVAGKVSFGTGSSFLEFVDHGSVYEIRHHETNIAWHNIAINGQGGKVGIGTLTPSTTLDVKGNFKLQTDGTYSGPALNISFFSGGTKVSDSRNYTTGDRRNIEYSNGWGSCRMVAAGDFNIVNWNPSSNYYDALFIESDNGNVGIGTTTPTHKLHVNGSIRVTGPAQWSDFVFHDNYQLPTLSQVEKHIKKHGHLEGVPSEDEIAKDGYVVGEMDALLLQKIEELTLYIIEQNKRLDAQEKEIEALKKQGHD